MWEAMQNILCGEKIKLSRKERKTKIWAAGSNLDLVNGKRFSVQLDLGCYMGKCEFLGSTLQTSHLLYSFDA